jgi:nucleoside-diphosphate-sugar epimerase
MFTIFGHSGFLGLNLVKNLKKEKIFLPPRNRFIFKKNLGHIIYCIGSDDWKKDPINSFDANLGYLPLIIRNNKFKSFTYISSCRIYNNSETTTESSFFKVNPTKSDEYYDLKKILSENFLFSSKINFKIIRVSNILGYSPKSPLVFPMFVKNAIFKKQITISINKNSSKDFVHIDDVVQLIIKIIKKGKSNIYNLASGKNIELITLANMIKSKIKCKIILKNQSIKIIEPKINITKIRNEFNFKPKKIFFDFDDILKKYKNK